MALLGSAGESSAAGCSYSNVKACTNTTICKNATSLLGTLGSGSRLSQYTRQKPRGVDLTVGLKLLKLHR